MDIRGKWALVTGSTRRVGREIALELARHGAGIVLHCGAAPAAEAQSTAAEVEAMGVPCRTVRADFSQPDFAARVGQLAAELDRDGVLVSVLVNSASVFTRTPLESASADEWDRQMAVNLRAPFLMSREFGMRMARAGGGAIVNIGDCLASRPYKHYLPYLVSKAALAAMTRALAVELGPAVRVNCVSPGVVAPPEDWDEARVEPLRRRTVLERLGSPADVARAVSYLVRDGGFCTGAELVVDGGASLH